MKLNKFAYLYSKPLGNHTLKIMKKYLEIYQKKPGKIMKISWNFVSPKKWEPWLLKWLVSIDEELLNIYNWSFLYLGFELDSDSVEYEEVVKDFYNTMPRSCEIIQILHTVNPLLRKEYHEWVNSSSAMHSRL